MSAAAISQRSFARLAGVSPAAVRHALAAGRLEEGDAGMDFEEGVNELYLDEHQPIAVEQMLTAGRVLPGWSALAVPQKGRDPLPVCFLPPFGESAFPADDDELDDWLFDIASWSATDPEGKEHRMVLVTHAKARPPWLEKKSDEGKSTGSPRRRSEAVQGRGAPGKKGSHLGRKPARHTAAGGTVQLARARGEKRGRRDAKERP